MREPDPLAEARTHGNLSTFVVQCKCATAFCTRPLSCVCPLSYSKIVGLPGCYRPPPLPCPTNYLILEKYGPNRSVCWIHRSLPSPFKSTMQWRPPISTFQSRSPYCGPASCGKAEHGLGALLVLGTGRRGGTACVAPPRPGASKESVMVGNRGPVVEGHHSLTTCFTNLPTITARYITTAPHFPKPLA